MTTVQKIELKGLIRQLNEYTEAEVAQVLRGDENINIRRQAKMVSLKLAAASIKTGMEAASFKPVPEKKENK